MKILKSDIARKLKQMKGFAVTKNATGTIQGILLKDNMLIANNLEIAVSSPLNIKTDESFVIPLSAVELILNLSEGEIEIKQDKDKIIVKSDKLCSKFATSPYEDFPTKDIIDAKESITNFNCNAEDIMSEISRVMHACSAENELRPVMAGILFRSDSEALNVVACDGVRLAWNKLKKTDDDIEAIIKKTDLQKIMTLDLAGAMKIYLFNGNKIAFQTSEYAVFIRTLSGDYMKYRDVYNKVNDSYKRITINTAEMMESIKRAMICSGGNNHVALVCEIKSDSINLSIDSAVSEFSEEVCDVSGNITEPIKIAVNAAFLYDCLKAANAETVDVMITNSVQPLLVKSDTLEQIIMPVRLK